MDEQLPDDSASPSALLLWSCFLPENTQYKTHLCSCASETKPRSLSLWLHHGQAPLQSLDPCVKEAAAAQGLSPDPQSIQTQTVITDLHPHAQYETCLLVINLHLSSAGKSVYQFYVDDDMPCNCL